MKLPGVLTSLFPQKTQEIKTYLALELLATRIKVLAWDLVGDKITVLSEASSEFQGETEEEKISACDLAISQVEQKIPHGQKLSQVVFGLMEKMVVGDKISDTTLVFLKRLSEELSLTPVGFVVVNEALANFLKKEEGMPPTVILVNYSDNNLSCALVKIGKVEMIQHQNEVTNISETLALMFKEFGVEILPSRILLYDSGANLETARQELMSYPWLSKANFLHFPKFEILANNEDLKAIAFAGSSELLSREVKFDMTTDNNEPTGELVRKVEKVEQVGQVEKVEEVEKEEQLTPDEEKHEEKIADLESANREELGFVADQDVLKLREDEKSFEAESFKDIEENVEEEKQSAKPKNINVATKTQNAFVIPLSHINLKSIFAKMFLPKISLPKINMPDFLPDNLNNKTPLLIIGLLLLVLIGILGGAYWTLPKAKVTLVVAPKVLEKNSDITIASASSALDQAKLVIPGKELTVSESTSGNAPATGTALTGDPAKGQVTIFNKTENSKTFPKGTILVSSSGLKFSLDSDVAVASTSAFATSFASIVGNVTATKIGTDSNLPFGTNFTFADFPASSFFAKNDNAFSGGTSKQVQAVSKDDQDKLLKSLTNQLLDKAKAELVGKSTAGEKIIDETVKTTVTKKTFSVPVDGQASQFSLNLGVDFSALTYNENDVKTVMQPMITPQVPADFSYQPENSSFTLKVKKTNKDNTVFATVAFSAKLLPKINLDEVKKKLAGQGLTEGEKYLKSFSNVSSVQPVFIPPLPSFLAGYPHLSKNISLTITGQ